MKKIFSGVFFVFMGVSFGEKEGTAATDVSAASDEDSSRHRSRLQSDASSAKDSQDSFKEDSSLSSSEKGSSHLGVSQERPSALDWSTIDFNKLSPQQFKDLGKRLKEE